MFRSFVLICVVCVSFAFAKMTVVVSVSPEAWLAKQIGGDLVEVIVMSPPGADPHTYEPKPAQMKALADAKIYLACGVEFEKMWLDRFKSNAPDMEIYHIDSGFTKLKSPDPDDHGGFDTHIWLSATAMRQMAQATAKALSEQDRANMGRYQINAMKLYQTIDRVRAQMTSLLAPYHGRSFMINHPSMGYIANDYRLKQISIETEGKEPKPAELAEMIKKAKEAQIKTIFVQDGRPAKTAEAVAKQIGASVETIQIMGEDWEAIMIGVATQLINAF